MIRKPLIAVPLHPTEEMFRAFEKTYAIHQSFHDAWIAACNAAPTGLLVQKEEFVSAPKAEIGMADRKA